MSPNPSEKPSRPARINRMFIRTLGPGLVVVGLCWAGAAAADDWPTVHHDAGRSGRSADCVRGPDRLGGGARVPHRAPATPVDALGAGAKVFAGPPTGTLWALDRRTGRVDWKHRADGPVLHSPACAGGRVFYGDAGGSLWALEAATGRPVWRFRSGKGGF